MKYLLGIISSVLLFGMTVFAGEYTVTEIEPVTMYTTPECVVYAEPDISSTVSIANEKVVFSWPVEVIGITDNNFFKVVYNFDGSFYTGYIPIQGVSQERSYYVYDLYDHYTFSKIPVSYEYPIEIKNAQLEEEYAVCRYVLEEQYIKRNNVLQVSYIERVIPEVNAEGYRHVMLSALVKDLMTSGYKITNYDVSSRIYQEVYNQDLYSDTGTLLQLRQNIITLNVAIDDIAAEPNFAYDKNNIISASVKMPFYTIAESTNLADEVIEQVRNGFPGEFYFTVYEDVALDKPAFIMFVNGITHDEKRDGNKYVLVNNQEYQIEVSDKNYGYFDEGEPMPEENSRYVNFANGAVGFTIGNNAIITNVYDAYLRVTASDGEMTDQDIMDVINNVYLYTFTKEQALSSRYADLMKKLNAQ